MASQHGLDEITKAKLLLALLAFVWGLSWPVMTIALAEMSVWTLLRGTLVCELRNQRDTSNL